MCTVTWRSRPDGYDLFFNRDELNSRAPELPATPVEKEGVKFIAPRDGDHGGTWLLVNEYGLTACLLNDYANPWRPARETPLFSRGHLVLACAHVEKIASIIGIIGRQPLLQTMPFRLLAISAGEGPFVLHWNGARLSRLDGLAVSAPLSSSSYATDAVVAARQRSLADFVDVAERPEISELAAYHRQYSPTAGAHSVLMRRPDAATRSVTHVSVNSSQARCIYQSVRQSTAGPTLDEAITVVLPLARAVAV